MTVGHLVAAPCSLGDGVAELPLWAVEAVTPVLVAARVAGAEAR